MVILLGLGLLGAANWAFITSNPLLYDFFFGEAGVVTILETAPEPDTTTASPILYYAAVSAVAITVGVVLFLGLRSIHRQISSRTGRPLPTKLERYRQHVLNEELGARIAFRFGVLVAWLVYGVLFMQFLLPFAVLLSRIGAEQLSTVDGWLKNLWGFLLIALALHIHVIFARLLVMRPRLYGGEAAIEEALT